MYDEFFFILYTILFNYLKTSIKYIFYRSNKRPQPPYLYPKLYCPFKFWHTRLLLLFLRSNCIRFLKLQLYLLFLYSLHFLLLYGLYLYNNSPKGTWRKSYRPISFPKLLLSCPLEKKLCESKYQRFFGFYQKDLLHFLEHSVLLPFCKSYYFLRNLFLPIFYFIVQNLRFLIPLYGVLSLSYI